MSETYRIIKIIDPYTIVINADSLSPLKLGDILEIVAPTCEVKDPVSGENLGTLDFIKGRVKVKSRLEKMTVCESSDTTSSIYRSFPNLSFFDQNFQKQLNVDSTEISGGYGNVDEKIRIGDLVRKVIF